MDYSPAEGSTSHILLLSDSVPQPSNSYSDTDVSTDTSIAATPQESGTPTGTVIVNSRDRSGTIIARPIWDHIPTAPPNPATTTAALFQTTRTRRLRHHRELPPESPSDTSRPDTETEDDGDIDMDRMDMEEDEEEEEDDSGRMDSDVPSASASASASPSPERSEMPQLPPHRHHHHHRHHLARHAHAHTHTHNRGRRAVGIISDEPADGPQTLQVDGGDAHIIINEAGVGGEGGVGVGPVRVGGVGEGVGVGVGVEDGIVSLEPNDDFAMGAPPGAPGAIGDGLTPRGLNLDGIGRRRNRTVSGVATPGTTGTTGDAPDATPRAAVIGLPMMAGNNGTIRGGQQQQQGANYGHQRHATIRARPPDPTPGAGAGPVIPTATTTTATATGTTFPARTSNASASHTPPHHTTSDSGPYRDEDVLLSLQLLAYLSKYPHVRQAFYKPRVTFHPASVDLGGQRFGIGSGEGKERGRKEKERKGDKGLEKEKEREKGLEKEKEKAAPPSSTTKETTPGFFKAFTNAASSLSVHSSTGAATSSSRGKERAQLNGSASSTSSTLTVMAQLDPSSSSSSTPITKPLQTPSPSAPPPRQTNVFSLVERFTFKPSSTETDLPNPPPRLPPEIQYWAGVIMRNACRKDDSRGGIRQCANSGFFSEISFYGC
jgi:hypothetical protein